MRTAAFSLCAMIFGVLVGVVGGGFMEQQEQRTQSVLNGHAEYFINSDSKLEWRWKTNAPPKHPVFISRITAVTIEINGHEHIIFPSHGDRVFEHSEYCDKCRKRD